MVRIKSAGFTIVEIVIAMGILSVLIIGSVGLFGSWVDYKKNMQASTVADQSQLEISTLLSGDTQCTANLGATGADVTLTATASTSSAPIKDSAGVSIFAVGTTIGHAAEFEAWRIIERASLGAVGANTKVMADLLLTFKTVGAGAGISRTQRKISLVAVKNPANKIVSCDVLSAFRDPASLGGAAIGAPQTIYVNDLSVGQRLNCNASGQLILSNDYPPSASNCSGTGAMMVQYTGGTPPFGDYFNFMTTIPVTAMPDCNVNNASIPSVAGGPTGFVTGTVRSSNGTFTGSCPPP